MTCPHVQEECVASSTHSASERTRYDLPAIMIRPPATSHILPVWNGRHHLPQQQFTVQRFYVFSHIPSYSSAYMRTVRWIHIQTHRCMISTVSATRSCIPTAAPMAAPVDPVAPRLHTFAPGNSPQHFPMAGQSACIAKIVNPYSTTASPVLA